MAFQPVAEPKCGKVRLYLDVAVDDVDQGIAQVIALGGRCTGERQEYVEGVVVVMADPEEREFCLVQSFSLTPVRSVHHTFLKSVLPDVV